MKILHICTDRNIGGAGIWILNLIRASDPNVFEFTVCLPEGSKLGTLLRQEAVSVAELPIAERSFDLKAVFALQRVIRRQNPDIVHTHGSLSGRLAARLTGKPIVTTRHWVDLPRDQSRGIKDRLGGRLNAALADCFIATAEPAAESLRRSGVPAKKIQVVLNGAMPVKKKSDRWVQEERERLGVHGFVIGILARLEPVKGHIYLLEAAKLLKARGYDFTVLIGGAGSLDAALRAQTKALGLCEQVRFLGFCENPDGFLSLSDVQVNASYTETTCLSLLEGMSMGLPAAASKVGGNPAVIADGENGFLFPQGDTEALAAKIARLIEDDALRQRMSRRAVQIFEERFTAARFASEIAEIYRRVAKGRVSI